MVVKNKDSGAGARSSGRWFVRLGIVAAVVVSMAAAGQAAERDEVLGLREAVKAAQRNDPWLVENKHSQEALEARSIAAGTLPDPTVSVGLANFPVDTFDIDQEAMTQVKAGITQMMPRGDSLEIERRQLQTLSGQYPFQRLDRRARAVVVVAGLWYDTYKAQKSIALIEKDRPLFEQLVDVAEVGYSSALGRTRQQDIVRAQLELTRLEDRLTMLRQQQEAVAEKLSGWIQGAFAEHYMAAPEVFPAGTQTGYRLPRAMPEVVMLDKELFTRAGRIEPGELYGYFSSHPAVQALEKKIEASDLGIDLARQSYKPMWGVNASYGYRADSGAGGDRADFVSVGLSFDLPLFTGNKQDKKVQSAVSEAQAVKTRKWALIREMVADFEQQRARLRRLDERQRLYGERLLPQMHEQAEASLTAYTNDDGDFAEVARSRIAELNASIDALDIDVERQKTIVNLNYYLMDHLMDEAGEIVGSR